MNWVVATRERRDGFMGWVPVFGWKFSSNDGPFRSFWEAWNEAAKSNRVYMGDPTDRRRSFVRPRTWIFGTQTTRK